MINELNSAAQGPTNTCSESAPSAGRPLCWGRKRLFYMMIHEETTIKTYLALMEEATGFFVINSVYHNEQGFPPAIVSEICYLQFRLLCEIIALSCLLVHGDIPPAKSLRKEYNPAKIMKHLEKLNPHFYPQPIKHSLTDQIHGFVATPDVLHLSKTDLITLWNRSGDILHRAPLVKLTKPLTADLLNFSDIFEWSGKLICRILTGSL